MKIKKAKVKVFNINIDLVLCPAYNLFFQQLFCHKCVNYNSEDDNYLQCNHIKVNPVIKEPDKELIKDKLISEFSQPLKKTQGVSNLSINEFSQRLKLSALKEFSTSADKSLVKQFFQTLENSKISNKERAAEDFLQKLKLSGKGTSVDSSVINEFSQFLKKKKIADQINR